MRIGDFLCFVGPNFCDRVNWFFLLGIKFCDFQEVAFYSECFVSNFFFMMNEKDGLSKV